MGERAGTPTAPPAQHAAVSRRVVVRLLRVVGWACITAGLVIALYLVYALFFTNLTTSSAQAGLLERWEREMRSAGTVGPGGQEQAGAAAAAPATPDGAVALLEFVRPGAEAPPVHDGPLAVVAGVTRDALARGPGHYPETAAPGAEGNFAIAGHRTTYGAPFFHLDELDAGDEIHVIDPSGRRHVYTFVGHQVVAPDEVRVLDPDPLGTGRPMLTLTTCHPRFSARQRLVAFAQLERSIAPGQQDG